MQDDINLYKIWNRETRQNPFPIYAKMREQAPAYRAIGPVSGNTFWFLTRYEDCAAVLKDARFGKDFRTHLPREKQGNQANVEEPMASINRHMLNLDPPDHTRLRGLVHKAFTPKRIEDLRSQVQSISGALLDDMQGKNTADLIADYAFPLPIIVIADLLGVPSDDRLRFRDWTRKILFNAHFQEAQLAAMEVVNYFNVMFAERAQNPQDDLISALLHVEDEGDKLDQTELLSMIFLLLVAGYETTVNLIGSGMLALLQNPDQFALLKENPDLMNSAVEEMLRFYSPVENTLSRWAYEDVVIGNETIQQGDIVMATLLAANRDPAIFPEPDTFDITRTPNPHIAFGLGIHYCLGAPLARMEGAIAIQNLIDRYPNMALAVDASQLEWSDQVILRGVSQLPVAI